jgi:flagellar biosynthesis GTPase FlhF
MARKLKVFRTHIGFDDLIIACASRKAALDAWGASAHLFTQGFAAETNEPALVKAALARPGIVLRRQFGSRGEFKAGPPALRLVESPANAEPKASAKASSQKPATKNQTERKPSHAAVAERALRAKRTLNVRARAEAERAQRRAAEAEAKAEARQHKKQREKEQKEAVAEHRRDLQLQLQSLQDERKQQLGDIDRREQNLARERREIEQSFETRIVALQRQLRKT